MKKIVIIGSSGGNFYNLGGVELEKLFQEIYQQCEVVGVNVVVVQFIVVEVLMDVVKLDILVLVYVLIIEN